MGLVKILQRKSRKEWMQGAGGRGRGGGCTFITKQESLSMVPVILKNLGDKTREKEQGEGLRDKKKK